MHVILVGIAFPVTLPGGKVCRGRGQARTRSTNVPVLAHTDPALGCQLSPHSPGLWCAKALLVVMLFQQLPLQDLEAKNIKH